MMWGPQFADFLNGVIAMGYVVAGAFFLRFYIRTRDGLFLAFWGAFWLMAATQTLLGVLTIAREELSPVYLLRLAAFLLIIVAIILKNIRASGR